MDKHTEEILINFLKQNFPVKRIKNGKRFNRGIIIPKSLTGKEENKYFFRPKSMFNLLYGELFDVLLCVYGVHKREVANAIGKFFHTL